jgi:CheY-like chemotaxis protein
MEFRVWVLDDNPDNLRMIELSFPDAVRGSLEVRSFLDAKGFLASFDAQLVGDPSGLPDFVLLDFFLGETYGSRVLEHLLAAYRANAITPAVIVAHSSLGEISASLVRAGADFALPKRKGGETSPPITAAFGTAEALRWMKRYRRPPAASAETDAPPAEQE